MQEGVPTGQTVGGRIGTMFNPVEIRRQIASIEAYIASQQNMSLHRYQAQQDQIRKLRARLKDCRVIWKCKACKHVRAYDYQNHPTLERIDASGTHHSLYGDALCPCGKQAESTIVKGTVTDQACDARCMGATGPVCQRSCGGANHGGRYL